VSATAAATAGRPASGKRPSLLVITAIAVFALAGAAGSTVLTLDSKHAGSDPGVQAALLDWIIVSYVLSGLVAWYRRPDSRLGPLMIVAGLLTLVSSLSSSNSALPFTIGQAADLIPFAAFLHVYLAFPSGRLRSTGERLLIAATYLVAVGVQLLILMLGGFNPNNSFALTDAPELAADIYKWQLIVLAGLLLSGIWVLVARRLASGRSQRPLVALLINAFSLALVLSAAVLLMGAFEVQSSLFVPIQRTLLVVVGLAAIVFLGVMLDAPLARASVGDLLVELQGDPPPEDLRGPLARALHDPSVELAYWLPEYERWADAEGAAIELPGDQDPDRSVTVIEREGTRLAALVHDPVLDDEPDLLEAVSAAAAIALDNGRLQAELKAKLKELEGSRGRVIEAGQQERKRLERNLHDGAQQRLIALSLDLGRLEDELGDDPEARERIEAARAEIAVSLEELRDVARGLHPAVLSGHGLAVALESLTATATVPVELDVSVEERLDEPIEVAAYYVVNESLANIGKHAQAKSATVVVSRANGSLVVEIVDDGIGGADAEDGSGLRGLADRVEALGGRLQVWTPSGGGTRVRAEMPCG
jgi:signal transduction histidine kinase